MTDDDLTIAGAWANLRDAGADLGRVLADEALERAEQLRDRILDLRRPPGVVLWGGRPGVDLQLGSPADRERTRRRLIWARVELQALARQRALGAAMLRFSASAQPAIDALRRMGLAADEAERKFRAATAISGKAGAEATRFDLRRARRRP